MTPPPQYRSQNAGHGPGGPSRPAVRGLDELWPGYLRDGYFDADGNLRLEYVSRQHVEPLVRAMANAEPKLKQHQLRRFFQHCRRVESELLAAKVDRWLALRPKIVFLDAAAQDAFGKTQNKIPELFREFIQRNVAVVSSRRDFLDGFLPHFEAVVGFGAIHIKKEGS